MIRQTSAYSSSSTRPYADERIKEVYNRGVKGYVPTVAANRVVFTPDAANYMKLTKLTRCDTQGDFEFSDVAVGYFHVAAQVVSSAGYSTQVASFMQYVELSDSEHEKVVLTPQVSLLP